MRILVVDDDPVFLELCSGMLRALGHEAPEAASTARDALQRIEGALLPFDCLMIDIRMPGQDGIAITRAVRAIPRYARVPILVMTAGGDDRTVEAAFTAGATDFLDKPLDAEQLRARLDAVAQSLGQRDRLGALGAVLGQPTPDFDGLTFEDPVALPPMDGVVDAVALSNMVQTKLRMRAADLTLVALRIENARALFDAMMPEDYVGLLSDSAAIVSDALPTLKPTLAHTGHGTFVALLHGDLPEETRTLEASLDAGAETLVAFYADAALAPPRFVVGAPVRPGLLRTPSAADLIARSVRTMRARSAA